MPNGIEELLELSKCNGCDLPDALGNYALLLAAYDLAHGIPIPADNKNLLAQANCFICKIPPGLVQSVTLQLLRQAQH